MSRLPVINRQGQRVGELEIPDADLAPRRGGQSLHEALVAFRAGVRAGTAATRQKGEVSGSNRKPWAQKGLGRARAGYTRSPIWRGGGVVFGPRPRNYAQRLPRRVRQLALRRALSEKLAAGAVRVVEELKLAAPRTRELVAWLKDFKAPGAVLIVVAEADRHLQLAARNLPGVAVALAREAHPYQLVRYPLVLATRTGMAALAARLRPAGAGA